MSGQKFIKMPKMVNFGEFFYPEAFSQTVLPDRSLLIGQKLVKIANWSILAFLMNFCPLKMSGNTFQPQASNFQKLAKIDWFFWHF